uniref:Triphosphoribosyl-dephospho-CoA synthetase n=1 Tax=Schlesneria paludicola TaxID=360056 RepID=A0A7C2JYJ6_9PLAN
MTLAEQIELACLMEATARKLGNVHPAARFDDLCYDDFARAAEASAPILARAEQLGIGRTVLEAVRATRAVCATNVNLGICLLIAPLAAVPQRLELHRHIRRILKATTVEDAEQVYEAIRLMQPGGLGTAPEQDVAQAPTLTLQQVMSLAAQRDLVAREHATEYRTLQRVAVPSLVKWWHEGIDGRPLPQADRGPPMTVWETAVVQTHLRLIAGLDTLIQRKCGTEVAQEAARRAEQVMLAGNLYTDASVAAYRDFDAWLRADGHRRNPGTTADLIAACLFWAIREGYIQPPTKADVLDHAGQIAAANA